MKVTYFKCSLCEQDWEDKHVFGVKVGEAGDVFLVDPEESDKHVCRSCIIAIRDFDK